MYVFESYWRPRNYQYTVMSVIMEDEKKNIKKIM